MLAVTLLGPPQMTLDGRALDSLRRKNRALLYYLARREEPLTRDELLAFLWPDHPRPAAQRILRTMLSELRHQLGPALVAVAETISFSSDTVVEARRFEAGLTTHAAAAAVAVAALVAMLDLYRGDFLQGFSLADPPEFDDWVTRQREHFRGLAIRSLGRLAQLHEQEGNAAAALEALNRALAFDPLQEDLQRTALSLHYRLGERAAAIRRYEALRRQLDQELGVPPSPETRALYDALITDSPKLLAHGPPELGPAPLLSRALRSAPTPLPSLLSFTGRAAELAVMRRAVSQGKLILVEGEPGLGKTRLAEQFVSQSGPAGSLVLRGGAHESEQGLPYQPIVDALRGLLTLPEWPGLRPKPALAPRWLAEVGRLVPELLGDAPYPVGALAEESRVWEGLNQFLQGLARQRRLTLLLDDLHWADADTLGLVGYLARRAASPTLAVLVTARPVAADSAVGLLLPALDHEGRLARVLLAPFTPDDTRLVASRLSRAQADFARLAEWLADNAEGNPYFVTELVRFAERGGLLRADGTLDRDALAAAPILPATVENLIRSRLIRLSLDARRALEVAVVAGREFDFELVQAVAGQAEAAALDALDELRAAGLIRPQAGGQYVFDHSLTMEVAYRDMGESRFRVLHRRTAETLEALPTRQLDSTAGTIAYHFARHGLPRRASPYAFRAGQRSAGLAVCGEAIVFHRQALEAELADAEQLAIYLAIGEARFHSGDFVGATGDYKAAIRLAQALHGWSSLEAAYLALNVSLLPQARYAESIALGRELRQSGPPALAVRAEFLWRAALSVESAHPVEAEQHVREAERLLRAGASAASRVSLAQTTYQLGGIVGQQGRPAESVALYREALDLVLRDDQTLDLLRQIMLYNNLAYQLYLLGQLDEADQYAQAGIRLAHERGSLTHLSYLLCTSGEIALAQGHLDAAEAFFTEGLALARQVPLAERIAGHTANLGLVARERGDLALAQARLREALAQALAVGGSHLSVRIRVWLAPLAAPEEAALLLRQARAVAEPAGFRSLLDEISRLESA